MTRVNLVLESVPATEPELAVEIVERKGIGHPDTICDAVADRFSVALSQFYLERFGTILHHNVDKALLRGGASRATFGGGEVLEPIDIYLAGRAVVEAGGVRVPVEELAVEGTRDWLAGHLHALDPARHVRVHCLVRPGSADLKQLFARSKTIPVANDTSMGVGYAPLTELERAVLDVETALNAPSFIVERPAHGEDVKVMAIRHGSDLSMTVARAFVSKHVQSLDAYHEEKLAVRTCAENAAGAAGLDVRVNAADAPDGSAVYLTVTGTSAECGDDGEVGRGNRANGLISPRRPMSLEALAGKNPVTHVGKLYNVLAREIAEDIVAHVPEARYAECYLVSRIGAAVDEPSITHIRLAGESPSRADARLIEEIVRTHLARIGRLSERLATGSVRLF